MRDPAERQRALALLGAGAPAAEVARTLGVPRSTIADWANPVRAQTYERQRRSRAVCPRFTLGPESARAGSYAHLLGLYLGDGCLNVNRKGLHVLRITCDDSWPGLSAACARSMAAMTEHAVHRVRKTGCHDVQSTSWHWLCLLPQHGPGRKHERPIVLQPWQQAVVEAHPGSLLRGLFHSDGWRGENVAVHRRGREVVRYRYSRYEFSNRSDDVRAICTSALDVLGIAWRPQGRWRISVARREAVAALDEHVGPKT